ncbi:TIGR01244 family phosphatase [Altererythrobacter aerius]|uniref:TIGR01244 family phosphatase n=1 Tax=Tsuneonella aeria TaxID=1837929 RepID=A0A6I4TGH2_9SPHN|nr:TIGR01244 family phosphatase [Tsuneonella aeria]
MSKFRRLSDTMLASPQLTLADLDAAKAAGVTLVVNNRPDGESDDQTPGTTIEGRARALGMDYVAIPVTHAGFSHPQVSALADALESANGTVLAYCKSGTRSTLLWALALASKGEDPDTLTDAAAAAGYDVSPVRPAMDALAAQA